MDFLFSKNILILILLSVLIMFSKGNILVKFEDINVEYLNAEYIDEDTFDFSVNYINETYNTLRLYAVVIKDFPPNLQLVFAAYAYALGGFRIPMGFDMVVSSCDALKTKSLFMTPFFLAIGGDLDKCEIKKGTYQNESFYPVNTKALPDLFPKNKYKFDVTIGNQEINIIKFQVYDEVL